MVDISTSLLSVKKEKIIDTVYKLEDANTNYFHIDVMDGEFVENDTHDLMLEYCEYLDNITKIPLDIHLMVKDVKNFVDSYLIFNPNIITFHCEACKNKETIFMVENERTEEFLCDYGYAAIHCDDFCDYKSLEKVLKNQNLFFVFPEDRTSEGKPMLKEYENMLHYFAKIADSVKFGIFENYDSSIRTPRETKKFLKKFEDEIKKGVNVTEDFSLF